MCPRDRAACGQPLAYFLFPLVVGPRFAGFKGMRTLALLLASTVLLFAADKPAAAPAKVAPKYQEGSCCDKATKKGDKCNHPCCVKAAKVGKVCDHCNEPVKK